METEGIFFQELATFRDECQRTLEGRTMYKAYEHIVYKLLTIAFNNRPLGVIPNIFTICDIYATSDELNNIMRRVGYEVKSEVIEENPLTKSKSYRVYVAQRFKTS